MTRGVPANGMPRLTKKRRALIAQGLANIEDFVKGTDENVVRPGFIAGNTQQPAIPSSFKPFEMPEDNEPEVPEGVIAQRMAERFEILGAMTQAAINGDIRALIVSGPGGVGKSYQVEHALKADDPNGSRHIIVKGTLRPTGLYETLWEYRHPNCVVVFDDADAIFFDEVALNILKAVCDTSKTRSVSWLSKASLTSNGAPVPRNFDFEGTIIFISNLDFDVMIEKGTKISPHLQALCSRSHYVNMMMKTRRHCLIRIRQVMRNGMLDDIGLDGRQQEEVLNFIDENINQLRELTLRTAIKVANLRKAFPSNWEAMAKVSCMK